MSLVSQTQRHPSSGSMSSAIVCSQASSSPNVSATRERWWTRSLAQPRPGVGVCDHWGSCSQTAPIPARISCQPHWRCANIICQHARHHRRVLAKRRSCLHCLPLLAFQAGSSSRPDSGHPQRHWRVGSCLRGEQINVVRTARLGPAEPRAPAESGPCKCEMMRVRYATAGLSRAKGGSPNQHTWKTNSNKTCSVFNIRRVFPSALEITDPLQNRVGAAHEFTSNKSNGHCCGGIPCSASDMRRWKYI